MNDFLFIIYIICFLPGLTSIIFAMIYYIKSRKQPVIYYVIIISIGTMIMFLLIINLYFYVSHKKEYDIFFGFNICLGILLFTILMYLIPKFIHSFLFIDFNIISQIIIIISILIINLFDIVIISMKTDRLQDTINNLLYYYANIVPIFFYLSMVYSVIIIIIYRKKINNYEIKLFFRGVVVTTFLIIPIVAFQYINHITNMINIPYILYTEGIHFFIWNCFYIYYIVKIYFYEKLHSEEIINSFVKKYKITKKEKEIILLVKNGLLNKEIAFNLGISEGTVKIHIYNIFQKTNVNTRIDLINLISS